MLHVTLQVPAVTLQVEVEFAIFVQSTGGEPQAVSVLAAQTLFALSTWKPALHEDTVHAPLGVVELMVQTPVPFANEVVQLLQALGPGPQQVSVLCTQAVLLALECQPWLQLATPQTPPARQVMVPFGS